MRSVAGSENAQSHQSGQATQQDGHRSRQHVRFTIGEESADDAGEIPENLIHPHGGPLDGFEATVDDRGDLAARGVKDKRRLSSHETLVNTASSADDGVGAVGGSRSASAVDQSSADDQELRYAKTLSQTSAHKRAQKLARSVGSYTNVPSLTTATSTRSPPPPSPSVEPDVAAGSANDIPLIRLDRQPHGHYQDRDDADSDDETPWHAPARQSSTNEAHRLVRLHARKDAGAPVSGDGSPSGLRSGLATPMAERDPDHYVPPPRHYRGGILSALLKLYGGLGAHLGDAVGSADESRPRLWHGSGDRTPRGSPGQPPSTPGSSGQETPRSRHPKWYSKSAGHSASSLTGLIEASSTPGTSDVTPAGEGPVSKGRPQGRRRVAHSGIVGAALSRISRPRLEDEIRITVHIAETLSRQKYLTKLCRALMSFGAPTHRLEGRFFFFPR